MNRTEYIVIRVTPEQKRELEALAELAGVTVSQYIRSSLSEEFALYRRIAKKGDSNDQRKEDKETQ